jgi:hypothetical protein
VRERVNPLNFKNMKKVSLAKNLFLTLLVAFIFCGCERNVKQNSIPHPLGFDVDVEIVTLDGCEYIKVNNGNASWGSHKGNCKYCFERLNNNNKTK